MVRLVEHAARFEVEAVELELLAAQILRADDGTLNGTLIGGAAPAGDNVQLRFRFIGRGGVLDERSIKFLGKARKPGANEAGKKDTAKMFPGEVTRVAAKFTRPGEYLFHCHILSHEDHEMMRPYYVGAIPPGR